MNRNGWKRKLKDFISKSKKLIIILVIVFAVLGFLKFSAKKPKGSTSGAKSTTVNINRSFVFPALDNQGKPISNTIILKIANAEKTNQVLVRDQVFTAKNNKLFLIVNLELRNDVTSTVNILPGDLIRLAIGNDRETRYAPDLHNNLVPVAAISTKIDRVGFVIPDTAKNFSLFIGEIEGGKQEVSIVFAS